jgi:hypothetical protein
VQATGNLSIPNWTNVGSPVIATGDVANAIEPVGGGSQGYYRVMMVLAQ